MNANLFRYHMNKCGDTVNTLAAALNIHCMTLYRKINAKVDFSQTEIKVIADRYKLTEAEVVAIFLN